MAHESECNQNCEGAAGGMEVKAAELLLNATSGTPPCFLAATSGPSCTSHTSESMVTWRCRRRSVAKRLNTALRKLAESGKKVGVTFGGNMCGKLTGKKIETLSRYNRTSVRAHPHGVNGMQNAILASFDHRDIMHGPRQRHCLGPWFGPLLLYR